MTKKNTWTYGIVMFIIIVLSLQTVFADKSYTLFGGGNILTITSLDTLTTGEDVTLNFIINSTLSQISISLDDKPFQSVESFGSVTGGISSYTLIPLGGDLLNAVLANGQHTLRINLTINQNQTTLVTHTFTVQDSSAPVAILSPQLQGAEIKQISNFYSLNISSNEYSTLRYQLNNNPYSSPVDMGTTRKKGIQLGLQEGSNLLLVRLDDLQGNTQTNSYQFSYKQFKEEDLFLSFTKDKDSYVIGNQAKVKVHAPNGSNVNILIISPTGSTQAVQYIAATYPKELPLLQMNIQGDYTVIAEMNYFTFSRGAVYKLTAENNIGIDINGNTTFENNVVIGFNATIVGGLAPYTYLWEFGDGESSTEKDSRHLYLHEGNFDVSLRVMDSHGNNQTMIKKISIQRKFLLGVIAHDSRTGALMQDVHITIGNMRALTNNLGMADFLIFNGSYIITAYKEGFATYAAEYTIQGDNQISIALATSNGPVVSIGSPVNNTWINSSSMVISYSTIHDKPILKCALYWGRTGALVEEISEDRNINTTGILAGHFTLQELDPGEHYWKVVCYDSYLNIGESQLNLFTVGGDPIIQELPQVNVMPDQPLLEAEVIPTTVISSNLNIQDKLFLVDDLLSKFNTLGPEERHVAEILEIMSTLERSKRDLKNFDRDYYNLKYKVGDPIQLEAEQKKLVDSVSQIEQGIITDILIVDQNEFVKYPSPDELEEVFDSYLNTSTRYTSKREKEQFKDYHQDYQSLITVQTKAYVVQLEYLTAGTRTVTVIEKTLKVNRDVINIQVLEYLPKDLVPKTSLITFKTPFTIINADPLIKFDASSQKKIVYVVNKSLDLTTVDRIKSVLLDENFKPGKNTITGFSVSSFGNITETFDPFTLLMVGIVISLCIGLFIYRFDDFQDFILVGLETDFGEKLVESMTTLKEKLPNSIKKYVLKDPPELQQLKGYLIDGKYYLQQMKIMEAGLIYEDMKNIYVTLPPEVKSFIHGELSDYFLTLTTLQFTLLKSKIEMYLSDGHHGEAKKVYQEMKDLYAQLSPHTKYVVVSLCTSAHDAIVRQK